MSALLTDTASRCAAGLPKQPGTYLLWLLARERARISVGAFGACTVIPGWYGYVGSALGPGGLAARVGRHLQSHKRGRWHIDYLREVAAPARVWISPGAAHKEPAWVAVLAGLPGAVAPWPGFGASDRRGATHLYRFAQPPSLAAFAGRLRTLGEDDSGIAELDVDGGHA